MAITINGTGSITGLTAGGLPDGSVDADTLATDSVTAAKLKSDAIAVGDLPTGTVVKVTSHELDNITVSTSGTWSSGTTPTMANTYSVGDFNVTMTDINNYLVCSFPLQADGLATGYEVVSIFDNTGSETDTLIAGSKLYRRYTNQESTSHVLTFYYTPSDISGATATTRTLSIRCFSPGSSMYFGRDNAYNSGEYKTVMNVFEVAA